MAEFEVYEDEIKFAKEFIEEVKPIIESVEAFQRKVKNIEEEKNKLTMQKETEETKEQIKTLEKEWEALNEDFLNQFGEVQRLKGEYMLDGIVNTVEMLNEDSQTEELADEVCDLIRRMNVLYLDMSPIKF